MGYNKKEIKIISSADGLKKNPFKKGKLKKFTSNADAGVNKLMLPNPNYHTARGKLFLPRKEEGGWLDKYQDAGAVTDSVRHLSERSLLYEEGDPNNPNTGGGFNPNTGKAYGMTDWGYHESQAVPADPRFTSPTSLEEAKNRFMKEVDPRMSPYFDKALTRGQANDFLFSTGRDIRPYIVDQMYKENYGKPEGIPNRSQYNVDTKNVKDNSGKLRYPSKKEFTPEIGNKIDSLWNTNKAEWDKLTYDQQQALMGLGRQSYGQAINRGKGENNENLEAYKEVWHGRIPNLNSANYDKPIWWDQNNPKKQKGGNINDNEGYRASNLRNFTDKKIIDSNWIDTNNMSVPAVMANGQMLFNNTGTHYIPGKQVTEYPVMQDGGNTDTRSVAQMWQETTGLPWSAARAMGLSDGSYESNMKIREGLRRGAYDNILQDMSYEAQQSLSRPRPQTKKKQFNKVSEQEEPVKSVVPGKVAAPAIPVKTVVPNIPVAPVSPAAPVSTPVPVTKPAYKYPIPTAPFTPPTWMHEGALQPVEKVKPVTPTVKPVTPISKITPPARVQPVAPPGVASDKPNYKYPIPTAPFEPPVWMNKPTPLTITMADQQEPLPVQSGIYIDKGTNTAYVIGENGEKSMFPVLTGQNNKGNISDKDHPNVAAIPFDERVTAEGFYNLKPQQDINKMDPEEQKAMMDEYGGKFRWMDPITGPKGEPKPRIKNVGFHNTAFMNFENYEERIKGYTALDPRARDLSYGCTNAEECDVDFVNKVIPGADTVMVFDSDNNPGLQAALNQNFANEPSYLAWTKEKDRQKAIQKAMQDRNFKYPIATNEYVAPVWANQKFQYGGTESETTTQSKSKYIQDLERAEMLKREAEASNKNQYDDYKEKQLFWKQHPGYSDEQKKDIQNKIDNPWIANPAGSLASWVTRLEDMQPEDVVDTYGDVGESLKWSAGIGQDALVNEIGAKAIGNVAKNIGKVSGDLGKKVVNTIDDLKNKYINTSVPNKNIPAYYGANMPERPFLETHEKIGKGLEAKILNLKKDEAGMLTTNKEGEYLALYKSNVGRGPNKKEIYNFSINLQNNPKQLQFGLDYMVNNNLPKGATILEPHSISTDSYSLLNHLRKSPRFKSEVNGTVPLNTMGKKTDVITNYNDRFVPKKEPAGTSLKYKTKREAQVAVDDIHASLKKRGWKEEELIGTPVQLYNGKWEVQVPNLMATKIKKLGGQVNWLDKYK